MIFSTKTRSRGFTLIELLLVIAIIAMIATFVMISQRNVQQKRNDVRRSTDIVALQKGLALYTANGAPFPVMTGCLDGSDAVTTALRSGGILTGSEVIVDPLNPTDLTSCYYYTSNGATYSLRYTMQTDADAWHAGNNTVSP
jgi:prepilin-type N-terminal cleavage/methylation domain-containing protein